MSLFKQKYPPLETLQKRVFYSLVMSSFVFIFLYIFQPFGLSIEKDLLLISAGFGGTCLITMLFLNTLIVPLIPRFFDEENWFIWKELLWVTINILSVGFFNTLYASFVFKFALSSEVLFVFLGYTLAVGLLPIVISVLINFSVKKGKYELESRGISSELKKRVRKAMKNQKNVIISSLNEEFTLAVDDFLFAQAADNYIELYFKKDDKIHREILRKTLKSTFEDFKGNEQILKVHRSYIANLDNVSNVSGNAQGLKLHFEGTELNVPVSRSLTTKLRDALQIAN